MTNETLLGEPLKQIELKLKEWDDDSVEMEVSHCGICGSDIHTLDSDWSATKYPICGKFKDRVRNNSIVLTRCDIKSGPRNCR